jgi:hypothetical protein
VTFQQFVSIKNPRWSKDEVTHWVKRMEQINYWFNIEKENKAKEGKGVDTSLPASRWKEAQIEPTPIRSKELCYSCKVPWEPDHRCRGKGKVHIVEVHYDSEDEEMHEDATIDAYLEQSDEASDFYASDGQLDGQDDSACSLASLSNSVEDSTLQHSGNTCEDSDVLAPGMRSCMEDTVPPMELRVTQSLPSRTIMIDMTREDISSIPEVVEEPCVAFEHKGHMDLQAQEERHGLESVDYIHTYQYGESESPLLGSLLLDQVMETDSLMGYSLP